MLLVLTIWCGTAAQAQVEASVQTALESISASALKRHMEILGSDSLQGRGTGSAGGELAAHYVARQIEMLGLVPFGDDSTYFQSIPMHGSRALPQSELGVFKNGEKRVLELGKDYLLYTGGAQTFVPKPAPLVFVGYGIIAPEFDYNDYQSLEVNGKVVVFLFGEPASEDSSYFEGPLASIYSSAEIKQRIAISRGAAGSIMIPSPAEGQGGSWRQYVHEFAFEDITLLYSVARNLSVLMNPEAAGTLFVDAPYSFEQVLAMHRKNDMRSFPLATSVSFKGSFHQRDFLAANVIGLLPGSDSKLKHTYLLVSAHYDHLGIGPAVRGDSIYNGVFDNASGGAGVLEIARGLRSLPAPPKRSIIFLFITGEEKGLLGSTYYVDHPAAPLHRTVANLNVDGLAMFDTFRDVTGVGAELSTLGDDLASVAHALGLGISPIPAPFSPSAAFSSSDQAAFAGAGIPAMLVMEGGHYRNTGYEEGLERMIVWGREIYHSPFDDFSQPMNLEAGVQHCQVLFALVSHLANSPDAPEWRRGTPFVNARLRSIAEKQ